MLIIGECINSTTPEVLEAIEKRSVDFIQELAKGQVEAGANYIDVNAGARTKTEREDLEWLINTVTEVVNVFFKRGLVVRRVEEVAQAVLRQVVLVEIAGEEQAARQVVGRDLDGGGDGHSWRLSESRGRRRHHHVHHPQDLLRPARSGDCDHR